MVRKRSVTIDEVVSIVITCPRAALFLHIHHFTIAGLRLIAWQYRIVFNIGDCHVLFQESAMVKIKKAYKMKNELTIKKDPSGSFSIKARLKSFQYAFDGL